MFHVTPDGTLCLAAKLEGHGYSVTSLALSTDYVLRTGAFDHTGRQYSSPEEVRQAALKRYDQAKGKSGERLVSVSDDRRMFLWEQSFRTQLLRGDHDVVRHVCFSPNGQWIASAYFDTSVKIWDGVTGKYCATFIGHFDRVYQIRLGRFLENIGSPFHVSTNY
ncbi:PREDICTED: notchless protein homolog [Camelina sativa]|uniref:Notchless protein homolog n=1 Tax=Camelina sativa TaxID=90675 RepID=A0ABM1R0I3_CAMSA|nr:PREDICTED: notchless protein homolog [Camelina sativa]